MCPYVIRQNKPLLQTLCGFPGIPPLKTRKHGLVGGRVPITIVGVVGNTHHSSLEEPAQPKLYMPYAQSRLQWWMFVVVHGSSNTAGLPERLKRKLQSNVLWAPRK
jgi:hypothetical protein